MATLLQSPPRALSINDVAVISQTLADDLSRLVLNTEGFSVDDYLSLDGPYLLEYVDGCLQVLPMPDALHQAIAFVLANMLVAYSREDVDARVKLSPFPIYMDEKKYREPDVSFMRGVHAHRRNIRFWIGADLVVEVVSETNRDHDFQTKMHDYAAAGIPEYWIIDPEQSAVHIFQLSEGRYGVGNKFEIGSTAISPTLPGFAVNVGDLFRQAAAQA